MLRVHPRRAPLPGDVHALPRLGPLGRPDAPVGRHRRGGRGRRDGRPVGHRPGAVLGPVVRVAPRWRPAWPRPAPSSSTTPRPGGGTPTCPLVVPEANAEALRLHPQGHRGQPELHHDGGHPRAQAPARRGGAAPCDRVDLPGRVRRRGGGRARAGRAAGQDGRPGPGTHLRRRRGRVPAAQRVPGPHRAQRDPAAVRARRRRLARDRRGAEVGATRPRKILGTPGPGRHHHLRARAGVHRPLAVDRVRVRAGDHPGAGHAPAAHRPRGRAGRDPHAADGGRT